MTPLMASRDNASEAALAGRVHATGDIDELGPTGSRLSVDPDVERGISLHVRVPVRACTAVRLREHLEELPILRDRTGT